MMMMMMIHWEHSNISQKVNPHICGPQDKPGDVHDEASAKPDLIHLQIRKGVQPVDGQRVLLPVELLTRPVLQESRPIALFPHRVAVVVQTFYLKMIEKAKDVSVSNGTFLYEIYGGFKRISLLKFQGMLFVIWRMIYMPPLSSSLITRANKILKLSKL